MDLSSKLAVVFPGQGSQEPGMGRDIAEARPEAMQLWKQAEAIVGAPLREIYWQGTDQAAMAETRYLQPALTVTNLSIWGQVRSLIRPFCLAGHSLGEFPALAAAGVLSTQDVLQLVALRGRLMSKAGQGQDGKMAAVLKLSQDRVEGLVRQSRAQTGLELRVANYNTPSQFVVSGQTRAVEYLQDLVKENRGRAVPLAVSGAFHSPLIQGAADELARYMDRLEWHDAKFPIYFNLTAEPKRQARSIREIMARQMVSSVLWTQGIKAQWAAGVRLWLELGPKQVLTRMAQPILKDRDQAWQAQAVGNLEQIRVLQDLVSNAPSGNRFQDHSLQG